MIVLVPCAEKLWIDYQNQIYDVPFFRFLRRGLRLRTWLESRRMPKKPILLGTLFAKLFPPRAFFWFQSLGCRIRKLWWMSWKQLTINWWLRKFCWWFVRVLITQSMLFCNVGLNYLARNKKNECLWKYTLTKKLYKSWRKWIWSLFLTNEKNVSLNKI